jgi:DNA-binding NtrC family response regulator
MHVPWQILIASADVEERRAMVNILAKQEVDPQVAASVSECRETLAQKHVGLVFCARSLADGDYRDLLIATRGGRRKTRIVLAARITDWDEYLDAMRLGAFDAISAPCRPTDVEWMIIQALRDDHARTRAITLAQQAAGVLLGAGTPKSA